MSDRKYWLGFSLVPEIGAKRIHLLRARFGDLEHAWSASESELHQSGLDRKPLANLLEARRRLNLDAEMERVQACGAHLVTLEDESYPELLRKVQDAPPLLYVRGNLTPADEQAISIVGTRRATTYGLDIAGNLSRQLATCGVTIISGLAEGIDAEAHRAALKASGRTIAVLGCGIDRIYPTHHRALAEAITQSGALVSEFPIGTKPESRNFPRRNRIISGLSLGVLVIEAPEKSGAMITASIAAEQGRDVFAVPGSVINPMSGGTNKLIQDGAKLVMNVNDILDELKLAHVEFAAQITAERVAPTDPVEAELLALLGPEPIHVDDLVRQMGRPTADVTSTLTILELKGLARSVGGMHYCLVVNS